MTIMENLSRDSTGVVVASLGRMFVRKQQNRTVAYVQHREAQVFVGMTVIRYAVEQVSKIEFMSSILRTLWLISLRDNPIPMPEMNSSTSADESSEDTEDERQEEDVDEEEVEEQEEEDEREEDDDNSDEDDDDVRSSSMSANDRWSYLTAPMAIVAAESSSHRQARLLPIALALEAPSMDEFGTLSDARRDQVMELLLIRAAHYERVQRGVHTQSPLAADPATSNSPLDLLVAAASSHDLASNASSLASSSLHDPDSPPPTPSPPSSPSSPASPSEPFASNALPQPWLNQTIDLIYPLFINDPGRMFFTMARAALTHHDHKPWRSHIFERELSEAAVARAAATGMDLINKAIKARKRADKKA